MPLWFWIAGAVVGGVAAWALSDKPTSSPSLPSASQRQERYARERWQRQDEYLMQEIDALRKELRLQKERHQQELQRLESRARSQWWLVPAAVGVAILELLALGWLARKGWQRIGGWWQTLRQRLAQRHNQPRFEASQALPARTTPHAGGNPSLSATDGPRRTRL